MNLNELAVEITNKVATTGYTAANIRWVESKLREVEDAATGPEETAEGELFMPRLEVPPGTPTWPEDSDPDLAKVLDNRSPDHMPRTRRKK